MTTDRQDRVRVTSFAGEVFNKWRADGAPSHGAALAYYSIFAMAPLLVLIIAVAGVALDRAAVQGELMKRIAEVTGPQTAGVIENLIIEVTSPRSGLIASIVSLMTIIVGATGVFGQLQYSLNHIWGVSGSGGLRGLLMQRLTSFAIILGIGALLLVFVLASAAVVAVEARLHEYAPALTEALPSLNFGLSFLLTMTLFAIIFRFLPDARTAWRDIWLGAAVTALLFTIGKTLMALYLGRATTASIYGAAGSLVLILLWIYYSAQILLLGAEFTEVFSRRFGSRRPEPLPESRLDVAVGGPGGPCGPEEGGSAEHSP